MSKFHNRLAPRWSEYAARIVNYMRSCEIDQIISYDELSAICELPITSQSPPLRTALRVLEKSGVAFRNIPLRGYERSNNTIIATAEVPRSRRKTFRAGKRTMRKISCVDEAKLTPQNRVTLWAEKTAVSQIVHRLHGNSVRSGTMQSAKGSVISAELKKFADSI